MKKILTVAALCAASACSASGPGGLPKDLGCTSDLGSAEQSFSVLAGIGSTSTLADVAGALKNVVAKTNDLATVNTDKSIVAYATDASRRAGAIRVALVDGGGPASVDVKDVSALRSDINALDARCVVLGQ